MRTQRFLNILTVLIAMIWGFQPIQAASTLWFDNFNSGSVTGVATNSSLEYIVIPDPFGGSSNVLQVNDKHGTSEYMELRSNQGVGGVFAMGYVPELQHGATITLKFDVYLPTGSSAEGLLALVRLRTTASGAGSAFRDFSLAPSLNPIPVSSQDMWLRDRTVTFQLPSTFTYSGNTYSTDSITPIIAFRDTSPQAGGTGNGGSLGLAGYFDNISVVVTPEPSKALLLSLGILTVFFRRTR